ncbi:MAG: ABC transporter permease subunit [Anaerolineales bacterium]|jgi:ABC-type transport system involved in multi-copper enzyme maturation permease subunit
MKSIYVISCLTFREASRRWILWVALLLGVAFLVIYALGFNEILKDIQRTATGMTRLEQNEIYNFLLMAGLYAVNFLAIMMAVLTSVDTLSGEITSGTIHTLVSKPLGRWEIVMGKWFGFAVMLILYLLIMAGGVMGIVYIISGYVAPSALRGFGLIVMNALLLLSVSLMGGATLSTLANGVLVFGLYSIAFIGGWIEQFGSFLNNQTAVNVGILASLIFPSEAIWKRAAYEMQSPLVAAIGFSPFSSSSVPSLLMILYAALYGAAALFLAMRLFQRRDL